MGSLNNYLKYTPEDNHFELCTVKHYIFMEGVRPPIQDMADKWLVIFLYH